MAKKYHEEVNEYLADRFDVLRLKEYIPPHVTLKTPFETDCIEAVEKILERLAVIHQTIPVFFEGFGHFDKSVIFLKIPVLDDIALLVHGLQNALKEIPWIKFSKFDLNHTPHATIAYKGIEPVFDVLWNFVANEEPFIATVLNNISILQEQDNRWIVYKKYALAPLVQR